MPFYVNIRDVVGETWPSINKSTCTHDWMRCICSIGEREVVTHLAASPRHSAVSLCAYDIRWLILRWAPKRSVKYRSIILPKCVETFDKDKYLNRERRRNKNSVYIDPIPSILSSPIAREGLRFFFFFFFFSRVVQARGPSNHPSPSSRSSTYSLILFFFLSFYFFLPPRQSQPLVLISSAALCRAGVARFTSTAPGPSRRKTYRQPWNVSGREKCCRIHFGKKLRSRKTAVSFADK